MGRNEDKPPHKIGRWCTSCDNRTKLNVLKTSIVCGLVPVNLSFPVLGTGPHGTKFKDDKASWCVGNEHPGANESSDEENHITFNEVLKSRTYFEDDYDHGELV